jgi:hypothetical protein
MTIEELIRRLIKFWWVLVSVTLAFTLILFPWSRNVEYLASVGIGLNFNNPALSTFEQSQVAYVESFQQLTIFLESRFSSIEIQSQVAKEIGMSQMNYNPKKAFYTITTQGAGFVSISHTSSTKSESELFLTAIKSAYIDIVAEWNQSRQREFTIEPMANFVESVDEVRKPYQLQILPSMAGFILGLLLVIFIPSNLGVKKSKIDK